MTRLRNARKPKYDHTKLPFPAVAPKTDYSPKLTAQLVEALNTGHLGKAKELIEQGADPNVRDSRGKTAIIWFCRHSPFEYVKSAHEKGADINAKDNDDQTPLMHACKYFGEGPTEETIRYLLDNGADGNARSNSGLTAYRLANQYVGKRLTVILEEYGIRN